MSKEKVFTINGKGADQYDFGDIYDHDIESAEPYACANMYFDPKPPTKKVLDKYNLTKEQISEFFAKVRKTQKIINY